MSLNSLISVCVHSLKIYETKLRNPQKLLPSPDKALTSHTDPAVNRLQTWFRARTPRFAHSPDDPRLAVMSGLLRDDWGARLKTGREARNARISCLHVRIYICMT